MLRGLGTQVRYLQMDTLRIIISCITHQNRQEQRPKENTGKNGLQNMVVFQLMLIFFSFYSNRNFLCLAWGGQPLFTTFHNKRYNLMFLKTTLI